MKKIDFHIHTQPLLGKDVIFEFDQAKFQEYIDSSSLDAVAITNHNLFDLDQFREINKKLHNVTIFPGVEIDLEDGHLLLISDNKDLEDFDQKCKQVNNKYQDKYKFTVDLLKSIFIDFNKYLLIPHYDKRPKVSQDCINSIGNIFVGEVQSPKKFYRVLKETNSLTPVIFSDIRINSLLNVEDFQGRQTYIKVNASDLSLNMIKTALRDKNKVYLSNTGSHNFFQIFNNGQILANGLNIVIGGRSSGKSFLLNKLKRIYDTEEKSVKYIRQFDLIKDNEKRFSKRVEEDKSNIREEYLSEFRDVIDDVVKINIDFTNHKINRYIETLLDFASSEKLQDEFSKATLFKETTYAIRTNQKNELEQLLDALIKLLDNASFRDTIDKFLTRNVLKDLFENLSTQYKNMLQQDLKKEWINELIGDIKLHLAQKTSSPKIEDENIDFYQIQLEKVSIKKFNAIANKIKEDTIIKESEVFRKFKIRALASKYEGVQGLHDECGKKISFTSVFKKYSQPNEFLNELKGMEGLEISELYKYFCKVSYQVLNEYDKNVSGGEMAEFNLLKALSDARQYDMLLVDEPESSFDNLFLKDNVNNIIKEISKEMPVVVVTHNNTVGMLMNPDYVLFTQRKIIDNKDEYFIYSGSPGDKLLKTANGKETLNSGNVLLDALEAGEKAYNSRKSLYDAYKD